MNSLRYNEKKSFIYRIKNAEQNTFCIRIDAYIIYEGNDYNKICEVLSVLKNKK